MRQRLIQILQNVNNTIDYGKEQQLISGGLLDSVDFVEIVSDLEDAFDLEIPPEDILPEKFDSVDRMMELIQKLQRNEC